MLGNNLNYVTFAMYALGDCYNHVTSALYALETVQVALLLRYMLEESE